jgi:hypothetical protein
MANVKTGTYNVTTIYKIPWTQAKQPIEKVKGRKKGVEKTVHQNFLKCAEISNDPYWKQLFENAGRNKFPRGFSYINNTLVHKRGSKSQNMVIPPDSPTEEIIKICKFFFNKADGLMSSLDRAKMEQERIKSVAGKYAFETMQWTDIRNEKIRDSLMDIFIRSEADKLKFQDDEYRELYTTIYKGFLFKQLTNNDVILEGGKIREIRGLFIDYIDRIYYINSDNKTPRTTLRLNIVQDESIKSPSDNQSLNIISSNSSQSESISENSSSNSSEYLND